MLRVWNVGARRARVLPLDLRHVPDPERRPELDPQLHGVVDRPLVPRLHRRSSRPARSALIIWRLPLLRSRTKLESLVSREAAFLYNNLFLVALALTVLWGVVYPLVSEALRGVAVTVGAPYYNFFAVAFGLPVVLLMGIGPLVAWRRASLRSLGRAARVARGSRARGGHSPRTGRGRDRAQPASSATRSRPSSSRRSCWSSRAEHVRERRSARRAGRRPSPSSWGETAAATAGTSYTRRSCSCSLGAIGIGGFGTTREAKLVPGESMQVGDYRLELPGNRAERVPRMRRRFGPGSQSRAERGRASGSLAAGKNRYFAEHADLERGGDSLRPAPRRGPLRDRRPVQLGRFRLPEGAREPAREPDLARRARLPARIARHHVAGRARAATARAAASLSRSTRAVARLMEVLALCSGGRARARLRPPRRSPLPARARGRDDSDSGRRNGRAGARSVSRRSATVRSRRSRSSSSTTGPARSRMPTTASPWDRFAPRSPRHSGLSMPRAVRRASPPRPVR